ncbi:MAG: HEAT repeat domain-containing protein [Verrucomicrobiae bacterium]|nr:HEAT repeat domain-containing protein [Verrucomicrobiae bacterium]
MRMPFFFAALLIGLGTFSLGGEISARAESLLLSGGWEACACKRHLGEGAPFDPDADHAGNGRKYARDREIDVRHVKLEIDPDFEARSLSGVATMTFAPIAKPLKELRLDAIDLRIEKIEASNPIEAWAAGDAAITITFSESLAPDIEAWVKVTYRAEPRSGWYYRTEAMGYPAGDDHFWTQGEPESHRNWFPGYDYPNERFTSEVICRVPKGMTVLSNGRLVEERTDGADSVFHWSQEQEHVNYLISVVGGYFKKLESKHGDLPLAFLTPPSEFAVAENSFRDTEAVLAFLEGEIGVKFPWAKYYNVCVADFVAGGMENTSVTTLTMNTLFSDESENLRSSHRLDAHEATHQWFGDLLTCKDWSHLWLNEGFATYYTHLYEQQKNGDEDMRFGLWQDAEKILSNNDEKPIVWREYQDPMEQFDYRAYPKGAWVLHMLRSQLGPELFRKGITTYVERHRNSNVVTQDLIAVLEEVSGRSWDEFFDQWVFHGGKPQLKVAYAWDQVRGQAKLTISQTQKISDKVLLFDFPLPVRFIDEAGETHDFSVRVHEATEDYFFELPTKAKVVRLDPELTLLAKIDFTPPNPLLFAQLENANDMMGRLLAVQSLGGKDDQESLEKLKLALNDDSFYGVRIEAAKALAKTHTPEALSALLDSQKQPDARARKEVVNAIAKFYTDAAFDSLVQIAEKEANPEIAADAIVSLGKFPQESVRPVLLAAMERESFRHRLAGSAIQSLRVQADPGAVAPILGHLKERESAFTTGDFGRALDDLAYLARQLEPRDREEPRLFIAGYLDHPKDGLRRAAISALGTLEDTRSLGALKTFVDAGNTELPEYRAAEAAIKKLSAEKGQADEVKDLRKEMLELQKKLAELGKGLETLKKQGKPAGGEESAKEEDPAK